MPTRIGLYDGRLVSLFPRKLTNTAVSATLLQGQNYATYLENIIPSNSKAGSGAKRFGLGTKATALGGGLVIEEIFEFRTPAGILEILIYASNGTIYKLDEATGNYSIVKEGLNANGLVYGVPFNEKLVFCNGIDQPFAYDGSTCTDLGEFVEDFGATNRIQVDASTFTLTPREGVTVDDYQPGTDIEVEFATSGTIAATVSTVSYDAGTNTLTVTVNGTPFPAVVETVNKVFYFKKPDCFSFLFAQYDRLWALSAGETKKAQFRGSDGLKVFFSDTTNNENAWYNQTGNNPTQELNFIDMTNKARQYDELVGISTIQGLMAFHGRYKVYLWSGDDPSTVGSFIFQKSIPVGTISGKLIQEFPQDILFGSTKGMRSLTQVFQTETLEVTPDIGTDIETSIDKKIPALTASDKNLRRARSFRYDHDGLYGFKYDDDSLMVYCLSEASKGWTFFTGLFATATAFLGTSDGRLLVGCNDQLLAYGNDTDSMVGETFSDAGAAISCAWRSPWLSLGSQRWSNRAWEVIMEEAVTGTFYLDRYRDFDTRNAVITEIPVTVQGSQWDQSVWDVAGWDGSILNPVAPDKFLCDAFMFELRFSNVAGPYNILGVRPIGK